MENNRFSKLANQAKIILKKATKKHEIEEKIRLLLEKKNYQRALKEIDNYLSYGKKAGIIYRYRGEALAGINDLHTALQSLKESIQLDPFDPVSHFLKGLIELDLKNTSEAINSLRTALYLNYRFSEAAYYLGLFFAQKGKEEEGLKLLKQALKFSNCLNKKFYLFNIENKAQFVNIIAASVAYYEKNRLNTLSSPCNEK